MHVFYFEVCLYDMVHREFVIEKAAKILSVDIDKEIDPKHRVIGSGFSGFGFIRTIKEAPKSFNKKDGRLRNLFPKNGFLIVAFAPFGAGDDSAPRFFELMRRVEKIEDVAWVDLISPVNVRYLI